MTEAEGSEALLAPSRGSAVALADKPVGARHRPTMPAASSPRHAVYARLFAIGAELGFRPNATVMQPGDLTEALFVVVSGVLKQVRTRAGGRRQITALMRAGDLIGLDAEDRHAQSVEAATMGRVCRIDRARFDGLMREDAQVRALVRDIASNQIAAARQQLDMLQHRSADLRVAGLLLMLSRNGLLGGEVSDLVWWPMSYADMADYLGMSQETICRCFARLRLRGLIRLEARNCFRLLDRAQLAALTAQ